MNELEAWLKRRPKGRKPRKRIRRQSETLRQKMARYRAVRGRWLLGHPKCEIGPIIEAAGYKVRCTRVATHPHHMKGRVGELLFDTKFWLASCSGECHPVWVHQSHVAEAKKLGITL
jgi:hypothetical protein